MTNIFVKYQKYFTVFGGFLIHLSLGNFYTFGDIKTNVTQYMNSSSYSKGNVTNKDSVWISGLLLFGLGSAVTMGGFLEKKIGPSLTVLIGGWIMSLNVCLGYATISSYLSIFAITYGLLAGIGTGLAYGVAFGVASKWFPNNKGFVIGIVLSGFGLSQAIFDILQKYIVSKYKGNNTNSFPSSFLILGVIYGFLQFLGSICIKDPPEFNDNSKQDSTQSDTFPNQGLFNNVIKQFNEQLELKPHQLFLEFDFWILWLTFFMNSACILLFTTNYQDYGIKHLKIDNGQNYINNMSKIAIIGSIFNGFGRIFWGYAIDRKPYKVVMIIITLISSIFSGTLLAFPYNVTVNTFLFGFWVAVINFAQAGSLVIFPTMCAKLFGFKELICNYGVLFTSCSVGAIVIIIVISASADDFYNKAIIICSVLSFIATLLTLLFRGKSLILHRY